jgi:hypothetical protein
VAICLEKGLLTVKDAFDWLQYQLGEVSKLKSLDRPWEASVWSPGTSYEWADEALEKTIGNEGHSSGFRRAKWLRALVKLLPEARKAEAFRAAMTIPDRTIRAWALSAMIPFLRDDSLIREALKAAQEITRDSIIRAWALSLLIPYLPEPLLGEVLETARGIEHRLSCAQVLCQLSARLPERDRETVLDEALHTLLAIPNRLERAQALAVVGPHLPEPLIGQALKDVRRYFYGY